jgi:type I site-specific restriction endonuclease
MSTGVNIKKLHNCIFASSIKSYESVIQSIGRVLRTHISKSGAKIFDLVDELKVMKRTGEYWRSYVNTQWKTRESYYIEKKFKISKIEIPEIFSVLNIEYELSK